VLVRRLSSYAMHTCTKDASGAYAHKRLSLSAQRGMHVSLDAWLLVTYVAGTRDAVLCKEIEANLYLDRERFPKLSGCKPVRVTCATCAMLAT
jgi:hypothetical protein